MSVSIKLIAREYASVCKTQGINIKLSAAREAIARALYAIPYAQACARENHGKLDPPLLEAAARADFSQPAAYYCLDANRLGNALTVLLADYEDEAVTLHLDHLRDRIAPLYEAGYGQEVRSAYLELDMGLRIMTTVIADSGTQELSNGLVHWFALSPLCNGDALIRFLEADHVQRTLVDICRGYEEHDDAFVGSRGSLTEKAEDAVAAFEVMLERFDVFDEEPWSAQDWVFGVELQPPFRDVWPPNLGLEEAAARIVQQAAAEKIRIYGDIEEALLERAEGILAGEDFAMKDGDTLSEVHTESLKRAGRAKEAISAGPGAR
ncbi:MAG: hypothetical protein KGL02_08975 [Acidobacteriota bacterium]|nr:hypothetical protein [Acidobacteriota bacterium]